MDPATTLSYIRYLETENARIWNEVNITRSSFAIVAQGTVSELAKTLSKANTTFDALERRMECLVPNPYAGFVEKEAILKTRPATPGAESVYSLYPPHPTEKSLRKLRSRSSSLGRTLTNDNVVPATMAHPNLPDFTFGLAETSKRLSGWPFPKISAGYIRERWCVFFALHVD
jgi:hypothetical protein